MHSLVVLFISHLMLSVNLRVFLSTLFVDFFVYNFDYNICLVFLSCDLTTSLYFEVRNLIKCLTYHTFILI